MTSRQDKPDTSRRIAAYYDANTRLFLRFGRSRHGAALHRCLWGEGVRSPAEAATYLDRLLVAELRAAQRAAPEVILDMGCGVGGTMLELAQAFPSATVHGVTISGVQAAMAGSRFERHGAGQRCVVHQDDFLTMRLPLTADAVVAVEAFAHAPSRRRFVASAARHLRPGGLLVIADDFLLRPCSALRGRHQRTLARLEQAWHLHGLTTVETLRVLALRQGLVPVRQLSLTHLLALRRPSDYLIGGISALIRLSGRQQRPLAASLVGSAALTAAHRRRLVGYFVVVMQKEAPAVPGE